jgi:Ca2+-binding RTX toxin-like protein
MSNYLLSALTSTIAPLFSSSDLLDLGSTLQDSNVAVTSSGADIALKVGGLTVTLPAVQLVQASQDGHVTFADGTHLVLGFTGNDTITGTGGNSYLDGMAGNDRSEATNGHNYLLGDSGSDTLTGGAGNDHIYGFGPNPGPDAGDSLSGGGGMDYIQGNAGNDTIDGGDGNDRIFGGQDNDRVTGGAGNDSINGNLGSDTIDGGDGNDIVRGGQSADVLSGGNGDDVILGDMGADTMTGGGGADIFQFHGSDAAFLGLSGLLGNVDTITDFNTSLDHIALGFVPHAVHEVSALSLVDGLVGAVAALTGHGSDAAELTVGNDTYLFYSSSNGAIGDSVIKLQGIHGGIDIHNFI